MQERYLGDSHDYAKYALLRHLHSTLGLRLGVNWHLTNPLQVDKVGNNDGEKRHHFNIRKWAGWEPDLLDLLAPLQLVSERRLRRVEELGLLPKDTLYFDELVATEARIEWHRRALAALKPASMVFLDPDNGLEVPSATKRTRPKYALFTEALDYLAEDKVVISIQFARQCDPIERAQAVRQRFSLIAQRKFAAPVLRARLSPNLLFVVLSPESLEKDVIKALHRFESGREKIELVQ